MNFRNIRMEAVIPVYAGVLCSLFLCAVIAVHSGFFPVPVTEEEIPEVVFEIRQEEDDLSSLLAITKDARDPVLEYFRDPEFREWVIDFFSSFCTNRDIVLAILENTDKFEVPPALAFALSWEESRFNPNAVNRSNRDGSIDRGLFQLNNRSFPNLEIPLFFDININVYYGISHLRHCLNTGGSEVSALAMYNAGAGRVRSTGAPEVTLNYISRILNNRSRIESQFHAHLIREEEARLVEVYLEEQTENTSQPFLNRTLINASPL